MLLTGPRVLIVEDDTDVCDGLSYALKLKGYEIDVVSTGAEAISCCRRRDYTALVLDLRLRDGSSLEVLPMLRELAPEASIVIATSSSDPKDAIQAIRNGANDYLTKPIDPDLLLHSLAKAHELHVAQQRAVQAERLAAVGAVVAGVAHESRNALQRIRSHVDLIRMTHEEDRELQEDLDAIEDASEQLQANFEDLRQYSGPMRLRKSRCGLRSLIDHVWHYVCAANPNLRCGQPQLVMPDADVQGVFDAVRIEQVMRNLFENSLAACGNDARVEVRWSLCYESDEPMLSLHVTDNGPGFSATDRRSAFEPFYTTKERGTGLGLAICQRIIESHHGKITIDDSYSTGAAIHIAMPSFAAEPSAAPVLI